MTYLLDAAAVVSCTHMAPVTDVTTNTRVTVAGGPLATTADTFPVTGCPFSIVPGPGPQPCLTVRWLRPATRVTLGGDPAVLVDGPGSGPALCLNAEQAPQGTPIISSVQLRVSGQ